MELSAQTGGSPASSVGKFLDEHAIQYELVEHEEGLTAAEEARASGVMPHNAAKSILLRDHDGYRLAVIPASERLDVHEARGALGASNHLRLATEAEMAADFPAFELGAIPPIGPMLPAPEVVDRRILEHDQVLCNAGDHTHSILVSAQALVDLAEAKVADICEE